MLGLFWVFIVNETLDDKYVVQSKSNAYIFIVTVQELLLQPR